jgi:hypothetical protein
VGQGVEAVVNQLLAANLAPMPAHIDGYGLATWDCDSEAEAESLFALLRLKLQDQPYIVRLSSH